jgi:hypothetical protein
MHSLLALLLLATHAWAAQVVRADFDHQGNRYRVEFEAHVAAEAANVRILLSDYDGLARLSDTVVDSRRLPERGGTPRVRIVQRACVFIFCRTLARTMSVESHPDGDVLALTEPETSDYLDVRERWQVIAQAGGDTRVRYRGEFVPRFFVPPLIGPWLIRSFLRAELEATAARIELLGGRH